MTRIMKSLRLETLKELATAIGFSYSMVRDWNLRARVPRQALEHENSTVRKAAANAQRAMRKAGAR